MSDKDAICVNDPNYAITCKFLQKFAVLCNITTIDTITLQKQIENTDEVPTELFDLLVKLLRKNKYTVHLERWERAVIKFCYTYSNQDAWEIERFGYKKSKCAVKLRVLKSLLEAQFDINNKFKIAINAIPANELRSLPLGRDKYGNSYWSTLDEGCNLKIYQEHLDEETWNMVASSRDELYNLIERLKGNEKIGPTLVAIVDEDSSSINSSNSKNEMKENVILDSAEKKIKDVEKNHIECDLSNKNANDNASDINYIENQVKPDVIDKSKADNSIQPSRISLLASKPPSKKKSDIQIKSAVTESQTNESIKLKPKNVSSEDESDKGSKKVKDKNESSSEDEEEDEEEESDDEDSDSDDDDDEIEEPIQHVVGEGSGKDNNAVNLGNFENELPEFSEIVEEEVLYTIGEGSGSDCLVGNSDSKESSNSSCKKPMFFFGQPGCLKLSPTKSSSSSTESSTKDDDIFNLLNFGTSSDKVNKSKLDIVASSVPMELINKSDSDKTLNASTEDSIPQFSIGDTKIQEDLVKSLNQEQNLIIASKVKKDDLQKLKPENKLSKNVQEKDLKMSSSNKPVIDEDLEGISPLVFKTSIEKIQENIIVSANDSKIPDPHTTENLNKILIDESSVKPVEKMEEKLQSKEPLKTLDSLSMENKLPSSDTSIVESKIEPNQQEDLTTKSKSHISMNTPSTDTPKMVKPEEIQEKELISLKSKAFGKVLDKMVDMTIKPIQKPNLPTATTVIIVKESQTNVSTNKLLTAPITQFPKPLLEEGTNNKVEKPLAPDEELKSSSKEEKNLASLSLIKNQIVEERRENTPKIRLVPFEEPKSSITKALLPESSAFEILSTEVKEKQKALVEEPIVSFVKPSPKDENTLKHHLSAESDKSAIKLKAQKMLVEEPKSLNTESFTKEELNLHQTSVIKPKIEKVLTEVTGKTQEKLEEKKTSTKEEKHSKPNLSPVFEVPVIEPFKKINEEEGLEKPLALVEESKALTKEEKQSKPNLSSVRVDPVIKPLITEPSKNIKEANSPVLNVPLTKSKMDETHTKVSEKALKKPLRVVEKSTISIAEASSKEETIPSNPVSKVPFIHPAIKEVSTNKKNIIIAEPITSIVTVSKIEEKNPKKSEHVAIKPPIENSCKEINEIVLKASLKDEKYRKSFSPVTKLTKKDEIVQIKSLSVDTIQKKNLSPVKKVALKINPLIEESSSSKDKNKTVTSKKIESIKKIVFEESIKDTQLAIHKDVHNPIALNVNIVESFQKEDKLKPITVINKSNKIEKSKDEEIDSKTIADKATDNEVKISVKSASLPETNILSVTSIVNASRTNIENEKVVSTSEANINTSNNDKSKQIVDQNVGSSKTNVGVINLEKDKSPVKIISVETKKPEEIKKSPLKIVDTVNVDISGKTHKVVEVEKVQPDKNVQNKPSEIEKSQSDKCVTKSGAAKINVKVPSEIEVKQKSKNILSEPKTELKSKKEELLESTKTQPKPIIETKKEIKTTPMIEKRIKPENKIAEKSPKLPSVEKIITPPITINEQDDQSEPLDSNVELESTNRKRKNDSDQTTIKTCDEKNVEKCSKKQKFEKPEPETTKISLRNRKSNVTEIVKKPEEPIDDVEMKIVSSIVPKLKSSKSDEKKSPVKSKRRVDVDSSLILENTPGENEPPVRQSRRIAQLKIKEEAERRNLEEMVLKKMKEDSNKKKKEEGFEVKPGDLTQSESDSGSDSKKSIKKKTPKKKKDGTHPWNNSDTSDTEHDEEEEEDGLEYRDEELPPLKSDHEFSPESDLEDESQVIPTKRARTVKKEESEEEETDDSPIHACQKCNKHDHPEWILLCDTCDKGYHCSCLTPVLFIIPEGDWFCPLCQHEKLIENLNKQLEELDKILHQRELEKQRRERLAYTSISLENMLAEKKKNRTKSIKEEESSSAESSDDNSSDSDEPIYKLRKRKQTVLSYNFNEYDDLINSAIKQDVKEVAVEKNTGAGNLGRGKDISTIIEADKEEQLRNKEIDESPTEETIEQKTEINKDAENKSESDDSEPIKRPIKRLKLKKKHRKLNSLDIESDDDSDDDFKAKISSNESEEDENYSGSESESSLENRWSRKKKKNMRPVRERRKRFEKTFINDGESDESFEAPKKKKKKREDSDFSDFNEDDDDDEEEELDVDSDELCDDTDSSNSTAWKPSKKGKEISKVSKPKPEIKATTVVKKKTPKLDEDKPFKSVVPKTDEMNEEEGDIRRTRGKKRTYLEDYDDESSDDGIKPGVKRPDTPPEERELFIKKQEEIKRMLAAKNTNAALMIAAPIPIENSTKLPSETTLDSISAVPLHVIQNAKALDADYHQRTKPPGSDEEFDDLPEDFNPEDMDEEQIAKMMEEEDFAQKQLKLAGEAIRNKKLKDAEALKRLEERNLNNSVELDPTGLKLTKAGLEPKKRGRKSKSELQAIADARSMLEGQFSPLVLASQIPQDVNMPFTSNLQHGPSASISEPPSHIDHHNIPTTVFSVQSNLGQMEQTALLNLSADESPLKKRGRRKKITPLRESLRPINFTELNTPISQMKPELLAENKNTTVLSERLSISPDTNKLVVATPPQLYTPVAGITPSVITRLQRPSIPPSFNAQGPPRYFAPMGGSPHLMRSPYPATISGRPMQSNSPNVLSSNGSPDIVMQPGINFDQRIRQSLGPHAIFRPSTTMYAGHSFPNPTNLHHGLQPVNTPSATDIGIRGSAPPRDYHGPYLGAQYGGFYPAPQLAIPANTTGVTPPPTSSISTYEQFETLKTTAEPDVATPVFSARSEEETGSTTGTSEFSGLVSYFSSQHDDLET